MAGITLQKDETVMFPAPYVSADPNKFIVSNQRIIHFGDKGKQEIPASKVASTARTVEKPFFKVMIILFLIAAPLLIVGVVKYLSVRGKLSEAPPPVKGEKPPEKWMVLRDLGYDPDAVGDTRMQAYIFLGIGALFAGAGYLLRKPHYYLIVSGDKKTFKVRAKDKNEQNQALQVINGAKDAAKAMEEAQAAAAKAHADATAQAAYAAYAAEAAKPKPPRRI